MVKPYSIAMVGEKEAEIDMYGEVVDRRPVDFWTGEPLPGNYIALDDFLKDLDGLAGKERVTVHLNSVGGSFYAGLAIYNRLKALEAEVVTVNDALAASAGSIIFEAGDVRKVNAGSSLMIHGVSGFLYGYYNAKDLRDIKKQFDANDRAGINAYVQATGRTPEEIKAMLDKETWLTGQEIVDAGFADEVIDSGVQVEMSLTHDRAWLMANGVPHPVAGLGRLPAGIPVMPENHGISPAPRVDINQTTGGNKVEEIKTVDELRNVYPEFVAQMEAQAEQNGQRAERARLKGIEEIQDAIGDPELLRQAKYGETPLTAEQVAFAAMKAQAALGNTMLGKLGEDAKNSGADGVKPSSAGLPGAGDPAEEEARAAGMIAGSRKRKEEEA